MMARHAVETCFPLRMTIDAKTHIHLLDRHNAIHFLNLAMTLLASDAGMDMRAMCEFHKIGQSINPVPSNLEGRLGAIRPRPRDRLDPVHDAAAMASHASRDRRNACVFGASRIFMAVLAGYFVDPGVDPMAKRDRLDHIHSRQPRPLGKRDYGRTRNQQDGRQGQKYPVHLQSSAVILRPHAGSQR